MSNPPNKPRFVTCRCQTCDGNIEFDASDFAKGETRTINCPHCQMDTKIYVPVSTPESQLEKKPLLPSFRRFFHSANWVQMLLTAAVRRGLITSRFERTVFATIRLFAMFWAALMGLALITATINYLRGFPTRNEPDENTKTFVDNMIQSKAWQNFGLYMLAVFFILLVLTMISVVLVLLAIERNTRKKE